MSPTGSFADTSVVLGLEFWLGIPQMICGTPLHLEVVLCSMPQISKASGRALFHGGGKVSQNSSKT